MQSRSESSATTTDEMLAFDSFMNVCSTSGRVASPKKTGSPSSRSAVLSSLASMSRSITIFSARGVAALYATTQRANNTNSFGTSPIRVEAPLPPEHADAAAAVFVECILAPGDMLYIPKSMWHYVRSLTTSVSVNFWF